MPGSFQDTGIHPSPMSVTSSISLEGILSRRKLQDEAGAILIHGQYATQSLWLFRFIASKCSTDSESAVWVSDRIAGDLTDAPGVGIMRLNAVVPVVEACTTASESTPSTSIECVSDGIKNCLRRRSLAHTHGHDASTMPDSKIAVLFESVTTLLLSHAFADVYGLVKTIAWCKVEKALASPVVVGMDAGVLGVSTVMGMQALASLVIRVDAMPTPHPGDSGYVAGDLTITEILKNGKERSITQAYQVHPNGSVILGASMTAPSSAALFPIPVIPPAGPTAAPASSSGSNATAARTLVSAADAAINADVVNTAEVTVHRPSAASGTVQPSGSRLSIEEEDGRPLLYFEAGDAEAGEDADDDVDDDLDL